MDPEDFLETEAKKEKKNIRQLAAELRAGKRDVFFYVASGFDWQPLHRFSHLCDVFVYVDPRVAAVEWEARHEEFRRLHKDETAAGKGLFWDLCLGNEIGFKALTEELDGLAEMADDPWPRIPDLVNKAAWGAVEKFKRRVGDEVRTVWLIFIAGSPLVAYRRLFVDTSTAPVVLSILPPSPLAQHENEAPVGPEEELEIWPNYAGWHGDLGTLIGDSDAPLPTLLAAYSPLGWPTKAIHYKIPNWRSRLNLHGRWKTPMFKLSRDPWPDLQPAPRFDEPALERSVVLTTRSVNPHSARQVGAVVVDGDLFRRYSWPEDTLVIIGAPPTEQENELPAGVPNVNARGVPLLSALESIEAVCAERGVTTVGIQGIPGFEDEAADLAIWKQWKGCIKKLIIHAQSHGHLIDFAHVADEVD